VLAAGGCLILGKELYDKMQWLGFSDKENLLMVDPKNISGFQEVLEVALKEDKFRESLEQKARQLSEKVEHFDRYIDGIIQLYEEVLNSSS